MAVGRYTEYGVLWLAVIFFTSCSGLKKLPEDESLLVANRVKIESEIGKRSKDKRITSKKMVGLVSQEPNTRFLGMRLKLGLYSSSKDSVDNWWNRKLRENGEAPVAFDSLTIGQSLDRMRRYLGNKGYFEPGLSAEVLRRGKQERKVKVRYTAVLNEPYRLRSFRTVIRDDSVASVIAAHPQRPLVEVGQIYDVETLDKERERLTGLLRNEGYYAFNKEYISYRIDSALGRHEMDVTLDLRRVQSNGTDSLGRYLYLPHKKYYLSDVYFLPRISSPDGLRSPVVDTMVYRDTFGRGKRRQVSPPYYLVVTEKMQTRRHKPKVRASTLAQKTF